MTSKAVRETRYYDAAAVRRDVDTVLERFFAEGAAKAGQLDAAYGELWERMRGLAVHGGKRLRPYMAVLAYSMYGGRDYEGMLQVAAAQEMLHVSLLIHDDIVDKDYVRRGQLNIAGQYRERYAERAPGADTDHFANASALLAGDVALSAAHTMVFASSLPAAERLQALRILGEETFTVAAGQLLDMEAVLGDMEAGDPVKIARLKTASYSFVGPLRCGAVLARAPADDVAALEAFGDDIGVAFQLTDDWLGVFGDEARTGKSSSNDIREGKRTFLMQQAFRLADSKQRAALERYVGRADLTAGQAETVRAIVRDSGAEQANEQAVRTYSGRARAALRQLTIPEGARQRLEAVVERVTHRDD